MTITELTKLERQLQEYLQDFKANYDRGSGEPYGSNAQRRKESEGKYRNAIVLAGLTIRNAEIYKFLQNNGCPVTSGQIVHSKSSPDGFEYDMGKLFDSIRAYKNKQDS